MGTVPHSGTWSLLSKLTEGLCKRLGFAKNNPSVSHSLDSSLCTREPFQNSTLRFLLTNAEMRKNICDDRFIHGSAVDLAKRLHRKLGIDAGGIQRNTRSK